MIVIQMQKSKPLKTYPKHFQKLAGYKTPAGNPSSPQNASQPLKNPILNPSYPVVVLNRILFSPQSIFSKQSKNLNSCEYKWGYIYSIISCGSIWFDLDLHTWPLLSWRTPSSPCGPRSLRWCWPQRLPRFC